MNLADSSYIKDLIQLMGDSDLTEITIEEEKVKLTLKRERNESPETQTNIVASVPEFQTPVVSQIVPAAQNTAAPVGNKNIHYITSPLVGTYYASAAPDAPAYAQVGDKVTIGQTLCIVEAMKLMNEIESDVNGTIVELLCENATPVEFGGKILAIRVD
jgi:acetyl-CoA carboxylase biotin carboxyl carrier protein